MIENLSHNSIIASFSMLYFICGSVLIKAFQQGPMKYEILLTSKFPRVAITLKPMYPSALSITIGVTGTLIPWGGLDCGGIAEVIKLVLNLP